MSARDELRGALRKADSYRRRLEAETDRADAVESTLAAIGELPARWRRPLLGLGHAENNVRRVLADQLEATLKQGEADESTTG